MAQSICCFILYSAGCLSAETTNIVRRTRHKRRKVHKHRASSESTQWRATISQVNLHWFISRCKLVGSTHFQWQGMPAASVLHPVWKKKGCFYLLFKMYLDSVMCHQKCACINGFWHKKKKEKISPTSLGNNKRSLNSVKTLAVYISDFSWTCECKWM